MKKHTKIYMDYHNYDVSDWIACEHCGTTAVDIHHLEGRKMGGSKKNVGQLRSGAGGNPHHKIVGSCAYR